MSNFADQNPEALGRLNRVYDDREFYRMMPRVLRVEFTEDPAEETDLFVARVRETGPGDRPTGHTTSDGLRILWVSPVGVTPYGDGRAICLHWGPDGSPCPSVKFSPDDESSAIQRTIRGIHIDDAPGVLADE